MIGADIIKTGSMILLRQKHYIYRICFMMMLALFALGSTPARALSINDIRFGLHTDSTRMVLEISEFSKFRTFVLDNPYRLVIDLPTYHWNVKNISKPSTSGVKAIRQGNLQPGISRIVVDLDQPMLIKNAFLLRANAGAPDRLVIDFAKTTTAGFNQGKDRIHGLLEVSSQKAGSHSKNTSRASATANPPAPPIPPNAEKSRPLVQSASSGMAMPGYKPPTEKGGNYMRAPVPPAVAEKPLIIIDAGHGGVDPGAIGSNGVFEKHITLAAARELQRALNATGRYQAELTRNSDKYLKLYQRVSIARKKKADLFISLHADTVGKSNVTGASIYTLSEKSSDAQTEKLAARENKADLIAGVDLSTEDEEVASILVDLTMRDTMNQSKFFANTIVSQMDNSGLKTLERPHRYAGFAVLKAPDIPSVLIELGFLSNRREAERLSTPAYRQQIIRALIKGIDGYFEKVRINQKT